MKRQQADIWESDSQQTAGHSMIRSSKNYRLSGGGKHEEQPTHFVKRREQSMNQAKTSEMTVFKGTQNTACNIHVKVLVQWSMVVAISISMLVRTTISIDTKVMKRQQADIWESDSQQTAGHSMIRSSKNYRLSFSSLRTA